MKKLITLLLLSVITVAAQNVTITKTPATDPNPNQLTPSGKVIVVPSGGSITAIGNGTIISTGGTATTVPWSGVTGTPTTLTGYGVTNTLGTTAPLTGGGILASGLTLSLPAATGSVSGYLTAADWTAFNSKQAAGSYLTALTGDGTAMGPGSAVFTLGNVTTAGMFGNATQVGQITVNAKGLVTSASSITLTPAAASITGILSGSQGGTGVNNGNHTIATLTANGNVNITGTGGNVTLVTSEGSYLQLGPSTASPLTTEGAISPIIRAKAQSGGKVTVGFLGDSLTGGASGGRVGDTVTAGMANALGYGGLWFPFEDYPSQDPGFEYLLGSAATPAALDWSQTYESLGWSTWTTMQTSGFGAYGFDGKGIYKTGASGSQKIYLKFPRQPFTQVTLFYLKGPSLGSFDFGKDGNLQTVSCSAASTSVGYVTRNIWNGTADDAIVSIQNGTGDIYFFAMYLQNNTGGSVVAINGVGGAKAQDFASLNAAAFSTYIKVMAPDVMVVNLGTNDYATRTANQFQTDMQTVITNLRTGVPNLPIVLTIPYTANSLNSPGFGVNYQTAFANLVTNNSGVTLFWWRDILGESAPGWTVDGTHPNQNACALLGNGYIELFGGQAMKSYQSSWPFVPPQTLNTVFTNPDKDAYFTAATTNWSANGTATVTYTQNTGIQVTCGALSTGASLFHTDGGGAFTTLSAAKTYYARIRVTSVTNGAVQFYTQNDSSFTITLQHLWNSGLLALTPDTDNIFIFSPSINGAGIQLIGSQSNTSFTVTLMEVKEMPTGLYLPNAVSQSQTATAVTRFYGATGNVLSGGPLLESDTGVLTGGTWQGTIITPTYGGTGLSALGTGVATWLGTPSSANLAAALTDETGTGAAVFAASPTLTGNVTVTGNATASGIVSASGGFSTLTSSPGLVVQTLASTATSGFIQTALTMGSGGTPHTLINAMQFAGGAVIGTSTSDDLIFRTNNITRVTINATTGVITLTAALPVASGGTGVATLTGLVKGNGTSAMTAAVAGTDYVAPNAANVTFGNATITHFIGGGSAPTVAAGTGAGSSPTVSVSGHDAAFTLSVTTGTLPTLSATIATVTFNTAYGSAPHFSLTPSNANTSLLNGVTMVTPSSTTGTFVLTAGTTALTAATAYTWEVLVTQ